MTRTAILLHNLGGPTRREEMEPFLRALFEDPEIFRLPLSRWTQGPFARWLARRRADEAWANYERIGGSPLLEWTRLQAEGLAMGLAETMDPESFLVLPAMRYSSPSIREALEAARDFGAERILSFPLYPHYSLATTGSSERELLRRLEEMSWNPELRRIESWATEPDYLDCLAWRLRRCLDRLDPNLRSRTRIVYAAHGTPLSFVRRGDPYVPQIEACLLGVEERVPHGLRHSLAWQSRVGPMAWTRPYLDEEVSRLGREGLRCLVVVPLSFVSDHVETLYELDILTRNQAERAGIREFHRVPSLNADPDFLGVLTHLAGEALADPAPSNPAHSPKGDRRAG